MLVPDIRLAVSRMQEEPWVKSVRCGRAGRELRVQSNGQVGCAGAETVCAVPSPGRGGLYRPSLTASFWVD